MAFSYSKFGLAFIIVHFIQVEAIAFVSKIWIRKDNNSYKIISSSSEIRLAS